VILPQRSSRDQVIDDFRWVINARQFLIEALVAVREPFMVETEQLQHRGMKVMDVDRIFHDVVTEIVRLTVDLPPFGASAGHPHTEATGMVIATVIFLAQLALRIDRPAKLASPNDQRVVKKPTLLQIFDQTMTWLIDVLALIGQTTVHVRMMIPVVVVDLDKPHTSFGKTPGH
jgi:hypothetical protein